MNASVGTWIRAVRPRTLGASLVPVLVGLAIASRTTAIETLTASLTFVAAFLIQIGTNLANDYYDFLSGADADNRLGPTRVSQSGLIRPTVVRNASFAVLSAAGLCGALLILHGGWPIAIIGIASLTCALAYTTGPWPLAHRGLGDLFVLVFFGIVAVNGTLWLQGVGPSTGSLLLATAVGCLATAILVVNNLRDIATDALVGKNTVAVRIGPRLTVVQYRALLLIPFLLLPLLQSTYGLGIMLPLLCIPAALREARQISRREGFALNQSLAATARLHGIYGMLLSLGLLM
ncbi:MAG: 1,4-dihydroxy-2-naphthoate polyprenyltransferase [Candidatus Binatia bacterium]